MYVQLRSKMVKGLREERSWTQRDLADKAGVSVSTVKNGERGRPVQVKTARKVAAALDVYPPKRLG